MCRDETCARCADNLVVRCVSPYKTEQFSRISDQCKTEHGTRNVSLADENNSLVDARLGARL